MNLYADLVRSRTVNRLVDICDDFWTTEEILRAVSEAVILLIEDEEHVEILEMEEESAWYVKLY